LVTMKGALEIGEMHTKLRSEILMVKENFETKGVRKCIKCVRMWARFVCSGIYYYRLKTQHIISTVR